MPQLLSRMDQSGWLTPSVADILEQGAAPPAGEEIIRAQAIELQRALGEQGTPARIIHVRPTSSRTLYTARPEAIIRAGKPQMLSSANIAPSFARLAEKHPDWALGFLSPAQDPDTVGILLRTDQHKPLRLRQLLARTAFREHASALALVMGVTLEQQPVVRDFEQSGHLLIVGAEERRHHVVWGLLLTLILLNTPTEVRLALTGARSQVYKSLADHTPHVLGRLLTTPAESQRLLDGLLKEVQRRKQWFREKKVDNLREYNAALKESNTPRLPSIVLVLDTLSDPEWKSSRDRWASAIRTLLLDGAAAGIYVLLTADQSADVPDSVENAVSAQIIVEPSAAQYKMYASTLHHSSLQFIDALLIERGDTIKATPLELYAVGDEEIQRAATYWRHAAAQRVQSTATANPKVRTGVTGLLSPPSSIVATAELRQVEFPPFSEPSKIEAETLPKPPLALNSIKNEQLLQQAQALAAYLGWLGAGPLQDVLLLSPEDAQIIIAALQKQGIIESGDSPTLRFARLAENPFRGEG